MAYDAFHRWLSLPKYFRGLSPITHITYGYTNALDLFLLGIRNQKEFAKIYGIREQGTLTRWRATWIGDPETEEEEIDLTRFSTKFMFDTFKQRAVLPTNRHLLRDLEFLAHITGEWPKDRTLYIDQQRDEYFRRTLKLFRTVARTVYGMELIHYRDTPQGQAFEELRQRVLYRKYPSRTHEEQEGYDDWAELLVPKWPKKELAPAKPLEPVTPAEKPEPPREEPLTLPDPWHEDEIRRKRNTQWIRGRGPMPG